MFSFSIPPRTLIKHSERLEGCEITLVGCIYKIADRVKRELNRDIIIVEGFRSPEQQHERFLHGRFGDTRPIITNADSGHSPHEYHCACDIWVMDEAGTSVDWNAHDITGIIKEEVGGNSQLVWGGNFTTVKGDFGHIETAWWREVRAGTRKIIAHTTSEVNSLKDKLIHNNKPITEAKNHSELGIATDS